MSSKFLDQLKEAILEAKSTNEVEMLRKGSLPYYEYQWGGVQFGIEKRRFILGDEMGLGKSLQAIGIAEELDPLRQMFIIIVSPKSAKSVWKQEVKKWINEDVTVIDSLAGWNTCAMQLMQPQTRITVCNFEQAREFAAQIMCFPYGLLIIDEAHKLRNTDTKLYKAFKEICAHFVLQPLVLITGTPLINNPGDLYALLHLIDNYRFPSKERFINAWFYVGGQGLRATKTYKHKSVSMFQQEMAKFMIRRMRKDVIDLPPVKYIEVPVELEGEQKRIYTQMRDLFMAEISESEAILATYLIVQITRLKQICLSHKLLVEDSCEGIKTDMLIDDLEEIPGKVVITSSFSKYLRPLKKRLEQEGHGVGIITGSTSEADREKDVWEFQNSENKNIFLLSTKAGGESITLTKANTFIFTDKPWTAAAEDQVFGRVYRIGQEEKVFKRYYKATDTIEDWIEQVIDRKRTLFGDSIPVTTVRRMLYGDN